MINSKGEKRSLHHCMSRTGGGKNCTASRGTQCCWSSISARLEKGGGVVTSIGGWGRSVQGTRDSIVIRDSLLDTQNRKVHGLSGFAKGRYRWRVGGESQEKLSRPNKEASKPNMKLKERSCKRTIPRYGKGKEISLSQQPNYPRVQGPAIRRGGSAVLVSKPF